jgi:hypothetical protein
MDVGVIVYCAEHEAPVLRDTARRILEAEAARSGVPLGRAEVLRRRARGGPAVHVLAAAGCDTTGLVLIPVIHARHDDH